MTTRMSVPSDFPRRRSCPFDPPAELRRPGPIRRVRLRDGSTPWLVTRYADARAVLSDQRFSADATRPGYPAFNAFRARPDTARTFATMDDPAHSRYRRMLTADFTLRRAEALRPSVERAVDGLLDAMAAGPRPVDLVAAFAEPLPTVVLGELLGVRHTDDGRFRELSHLTRDRQVDPRRAAQAGGELADYLVELISVKLTELGDDLISRLMVDRVRTGELSGGDLVAMAATLLSVEGLTNMIALGTLILLRHPEQAAAVRDVPAVVDGAVEEILRVLTIAQHGRRRVATADIEIGAVLIRAGEGVIVALEAANRDPEVFDSPDEFDIHRRGNPHLAFGFGVHQCLAQSVSRVVLRVAYPAVLRRFPGLRVAVDLADLRFLDDLPDYGVAALPVTWG